MAMSGPGDMVADGDEERKPPPPPGPTVAPAREDEEAPAQGDADLVPPGTTPGV